MLAEARWALKDTMLIGGKSALNDSHFSSERSVSMRANPTKCNHALKHPENLQPWRSVMPAHDAASKPR